MTVTRGRALILAVCCRRRSSTRVESGARRRGRRPRRVRSEGDQRRASTGKGTSLVIEATEPVPYVATRPDPLTVLSTSATSGRGGVANRRRGRRESADRGGGGRSRPTSLGAPASRVRITLAQPVAHRVRSDRNTVVIDFDKPADRQSTTATPPYVAAADAARRRAGDAARTRCSRGGLDGGRSERRARPRRRRPRRPFARRLRRRAGARPRRPPAAQAPVQAPAPPISRLAPASRRGTSGGSPATRSASISRAPICAPCSARSRRSAGSTS